MKQIILFAAVAIGVVPAFAAENKKYEHLKPGVPVINQVRAGDLEDDGWCKARSKFGGYSVELPGKYMDTMIKIANDRGGFGVMHNLMTRTAGGGRVGVMFIEMHGPPKEDGDPYEKMVEQQRKKGTLAREERVKVAGHDADHMVVAAEKEGADAYRIKTDAGDYLIVLEYPKEKEDAFDDIRDRVLRTFVIGGDDEK